MLIDWAYRKLFGGDAQSELQVTNLFLSTVCILGALQRQAVLQGAFVKIGDFTEFEGFSCGNP